MMKKIWILPLIIVVSHSSSWATDVDTLVSATPSELNTQQHAAQQRKELVQALVEGAAADATPQSGEQTKAATADASPKRSNRKRNDENSYAKVLPVTSGAGPQREFSKLQEQIRATHQPQQVLDLMNGFVERYPAHRDARIMLGRQWLLAEEPLFALRVLEPLLKPMHRQSHPDWQPWFWAGSAYLAHGDIERAREHLETALTKNGEQAEVWVQLAVLEQEQDNHAGALQYLDIAARLAPDNGVVFLNRAYSLEHLGEFAKALQAYQQFLVSDVPATARNVRPSILRRLSTLAEHQG